MHHKKFLAAGAIVLSTALALTGCGSRDEGSGGPGSAENKKTVKIGVIAPLSGPLAALGLGIRNSADLAVRQANESGEFPDWNIVIDAQDDQGLPEAGRNAATLLADDPNIIGVVGPLNSSVGQIVQPVLNTKGIALVSPANTNPTMTRGKDPAAPKREYATYFRTCTTDAVQGPFAAKYLLDNDIKKVATIHDKKAYGQGLVAAFTEYFEENGGEIVAAETINPDDKDFSAVISRAKGANPQLVYYGGEYPQAGPLSGQMAAAGVDVPLMGGDGIYDPQFIELGGRDGDLATSVGAPVETLDSAKAFVDSYNAAGFAEPYAAYGAYSYDAANVIIEAMKTSLADADSVEAARPAEVEAIGKTQLQGASGPVAFDEYGDTTTRVLTVYKVTGGKWAADNTAEFQD